MDIDRRRQRAIPRDLALTLAQQRPAPIREIDRPNRLTPPKNFAIPIQRLALDLAGAQILLVDHPGQEGATMKELGPELERLFERHVLQAMQRVVMDEGPHRPKIGNRLGRDMDDAADLQAQTEWDTHAKRPV
jgi:hypothetical protein